LFEAPIDLRAGGSGKAEIPDGSTRGLCSGLNRGLCGELNNDKIDKEELL
jgi:hypothetical protein